MSLMKTRLNPPNTLPPCNKHLVQILFLYGTQFNTAHIFYTEKHYFQNTVGISYNPTERELGSEAMREGLHFGAPGFIFIKFSSVFKSISYSSVTCLNKDGLVIGLDVEFQYRVDANYLKKVVLEFRDADKYEKVVR